MKKQYNGKIRLMSLNRPQKCLCCAGDHVIGRKASFKTTTENKESASYPINDFLSYIQDHKLDGADIIVTVEIPDDAKLTGRKE